MTYDEDEDNFVLSTGTVFYAHAGVLGLSAQAEEVTLAYGYDGSVSDSEFTSEERHEIANFMIELWNKWARLQPI